MRKAAYSEDWESALAGLDPHCDSVQALQALRKRLSPGAASGAAELFHLRRRAAGRLPRAGELLVTAKGLEQATPYPVAALRARTIADGAPGARVLDATVGVGGDALALAEVVSVVGADIDPLHARYAAVNLERSGFNAHVVVASAQRPAVHADVLVLDPDRRSGGRRSLDPRQWSPTLRECLDLLGRFRSACIKLAPALDVDDVLKSVPDATSSAWQWTSLGGELVEVALWAGELARERPGRLAVALAPDGTEHAFAGNLDEIRTIPCMSTDAARITPWIHEPDPALVRSGLLGRYALEHELAPLGPGLAFLGGERRVDAPLVRASRVVGSSSADRKRVRALLREHDVGPVTVKKRGHPRSSEELAREFRGSGSRTGRLLVARLERGHRVYLVEPSSGDRA